MVGFDLVVRQVVLLPFPFSDLSNQKLRPALVLADAGRDDWVLCQITSKSYADDRAIELLDTTGAKRVNPGASSIRECCGNSCHRRFARLGCRRS